MKFNKNFYKILNVKRNIFTKNAINVKSIIKMDEIYLISQLVFDHLFQIL